MTLQETRIRSLLFLTAVVATASVRAATLSGTSALRVDEVATDGRTAEVTITNPASVARSGILIVRVSVAGRETEIVSRVRVEAGTTTLVDVPLPFSASLVDVGIVLDDGSPF